jgi:hypothetical protein
MPAEAQKRYFDTIEAAIGKARATRERATVEASDGARKLTPILTRAALHGASTPRKLA